MSEVNNTYLLDSFISIDSKVRTLMDIQTKELESAHSQKKKILNGSVHTKSFGTNSSLQ